MISIDFNKLQPKCLVRRVAYTKVMLNGSAALAELASTLDQSFLWSMVLKTIIQGVMDQP